MNTAPKPVLEAELFAGKDWKEVVSPDGVTTLVSQFRRVTP